MSDNDSYCTPKWVTDRLPPVDLDPCSNPRSTVRATAKASLETKVNGLLISWEGKSVYCNPPYSNVMPWVQKAATARTSCFLVNVDPSVEWWRALVMFPSYCFLFYDRIQFVPPPDIEVSRNDRPQALVCDPYFRDMIGDRFKGFGEWWKNYS